MFKCLGLWCRCFKSEQDSSKEDAAHQEVYMTGSTFDNDNIKIPTIVTGQTGVTNNQNTVVGMKDANYLSDTINMSTLQPLSSVNMLKVNKSKALDMSFIGHFKFNTDISKVRKARPMPFFFHFRSHHRDNSFQNCKRMISFKALKKVYYAPWSDYLEFFYDNANYFFSNNIRRMSHLKKLILEFPNFSQTEFVDIMAKLNTTKIKHIKLQPFDFSRFSFLGIYQKLAILRTVKLDIDMQVLKSSNRRLGGLAVMLKKTLNLQQFRYRSEAAHQSIEEGFFYFSQSLFNKSELLVLDLQFTDLGFHEQNLDLLGKCFESCLSLKVVNIAFLFKKYKEEIAKQMLTDNDDDSISSTVLKARTNNQSINFVGFLSGYSKLSKLDSTCLRFPTIMILGDKLQKGKKDSKVLIDSAYTYKISSESKIEFLKILMSKNKGLQLDLDMEDYGNQDGYLFIKDVVRRFKVRDIIYHISIVRRNSQEQLENLFKVFGKIQNKLFLRFSESSLSFFDLKELLSHLIERTQLGIKLSGGCENEILLRQIWSLSELVALEHIKFEYTCTCKWDRDKLIYSLARSLNYAKKLKKLEVVIKKNLNYPARAVATDSIRDAASTIKNLQVLDVKLTYKNGG